MLPDVIIIDFLFMYMEEIEYEDFSYEAEMATITKSLNECGIAVKNWNNEVIATNSVLLEGIERDIKECNGLISTKKDVRGNTEKLKGLLLDQTTYENRIERLKKEITIDLSALKADKGYSSDMLIEILSSCIKSNLLIISFEVTDSIEDDKSSHIRCVLKRI